MVGNARSRKKLDEARASIWDKFDVSKLKDAGFKLEYVSLIKTGGELMVESDNDDISSEVEYWKNAIMCYVLGAYPLQRIEWLRSNEMGEIRYQ